MSVTRGLIFIMSGVMAGSMVDAALNGHVIFALLFFGFASALLLIGKGNQK